MEGVKNAKIKRGKLKKLTRKRRAGAEGGTPEEGSQKCEN